VAEGVTQKDKMTPGMLRYNAVLGMAPWGIVVLTALVVGAAHAYGRMTAEDPGACRLVLRGSV